MKVNGDHWGVLPVLLVANVILSRQPAISNLH